MVQMPALNTPQFGWVKSRLPHKAQPVPPIFQPEVGARANHWASHHHRREIYVGWSTLEAIIGNKLVPGIADHYLGRTGYESQQTSLPEDPQRPDNLWKPVSGDHGAHGVFDARARKNSGQLWVDLHRLGIGLALMAVAGTGFFLISRSSSDEPSTSDSKKARHARFERAA